MGLQEVQVQPVSAADLYDIIGPSRAAVLENTAATARRAFAGRTVFNVNSTATGGGVAELLQTLLATAGGLDIQARWLVVDGDAEFFTVTKRLHNHLYGVVGDGGPLGADEHRQYQTTLAASLGELLAQVRPDDIVLLHDPQTAGLAPPLCRAGIPVVWRCHVGVDVANEHSRLGWEFLRSYLDEVGIYVFSRRQFAAEWMPAERIHVIPPSIDPLSTKNQLLVPSDVRHSLQLVGLLDGGTGRPGASFTRRDGSAGQVHQPVDLLGTGPPPPPDVPVVLQASRWDGLKDMAGVMAGFAEHLEAMGPAHLVLAGPSVDGVADDPEATEVLAHCLVQWRALPDDHRDRIHLACVPMTDGDEAAVVVNALQRHAAVVVQKSLAEGFGLTVAEAMWKSRPVVASAVGGIVDQVIDGQTGRLLGNPYDLAAYASAVADLLADPVEAARMGANGRERASEQFLSDRHLEQWAQLLALLLAQRG